MPDAELIAHGARRQLVKRILSSRHFEHAHAQSAVLRFLVERSFTGSAAPKEYEIAVAAMGRPASFDPRSSPIVRVMVAGIRERLAMYFLDEGKQEPCQLAIPKGGYGVVFQDVASARKAKTAAAHRYASLEQFWQLHLSGDAGNILVYTEPLFFRDDRGHYYRDPDVNDISTAERVLSNRSTDGGFRPSRVTYGCLWTGEVHCLLSILRTFRELGAPLEIRTPRVCSWVELKQTSLILLGNSHTNSILKALELDSPFVLRGHHIENTKPDDGEKRRFITNRRGSPNLERMTTYALITRTRGLMPGSAVTIIAADHCRAIEGAGHYLTEESSVGSLLERMKLRNDTLPTQFQLILRIETVDATREIVSVDCEAHRILRSR